MLRAISAMTLQSRIEEIHRYLLGVKANVSADAWTGILDQQHEQLLKVVKAQPTLGAQQATDCVVAVGAGPWSAKQATELVMGINANVSAGVRKNQAREKQEIASFQKYMTQSEMNKLQDATLTTAAKLDVIIHRMYAIGLHLPSEPCVAGILSMLWFSFSLVYILLLYVCVHGNVLWVHIYFPE